VDIPRSGHKANITALRITPNQQENPGKILLHLHGGGLVLGSARSEAQTYGRLAEYLKMEIFSVNYRMPPENLLSKSVDDVISAYRYLLDELDFKSENIIFIGGSAGGSMSLYTLLRIIQLYSNNKTEHLDTDEPNSSHPLPLPLPRGAVLMSMGSGIDIVTKQEYSPNDLPRSFVGADDVAASKWMRSFWANDCRNVDFLKSLSSYIPSLPPLMVTVGEYEILTGLIQGAVKLFTNSSVKISYKEYAKMIHCHINGIAFGVPESKQIMEDVSCWIKIQFGSGL